MSDYDKNQDLYTESDTFNDIRNRSVDDFLEDKLESTRFKPGYTKSSVKEYINRLLREVEYQKENFEERLEEILEEKDFIQNERNLLQQQLKESIESTKKLNSDDYISETLGKLKALEGKFDEEVKIKEELQKDNDNYKNQIEEFENILKEYETKLDELENKSQKEENVPLINSKDLEEKDSEIRELCLQIDTLKGLNEELTSDFNKLSKEKEKLEGIHKEDYIVLQRENKKLRKNLDEYNNKQFNNSQNENLKNQLEIENQELKARIKLLKDSLKEIDVLRKHNKLLDDELIKLSHMVTELSENDKKSKIELVSMQSKLETTNNKHSYEIKELNTRISREKSKLHSIKKENKDIQQKLLYAIEYTNELYDKYLYMNSLNEILHKQLEVQRFKNRKAIGLDMPPLSLEAIKNIKTEENNYPELYDENHTDNE